MSAPTTGSGLELGNKKAPSLSNSYILLPTAIAEAWRALRSVSGNADTARSSQLSWCSKETNLAPDCGWPQHESTSQNQAEAKHSSWLSTHLWPPGYRELLQAVPRALLQHCSPEQVYMEAGRPP